MLNTLGRATSPLSEWLIFSLLSVRSKPPMNGLGASYECTRMLKQTNSSKSVQLRALLQPGRLGFLMGAHDGLSTRIAERAGFDGIWGSSLCISAALGMRDRNEVSWTLLLDVAELMNESTRLPILLDADEGHGDFNNARRLVARASQRGIAGVSIEDKRFPKRNSLLDGPQGLASADEFCGKIRACREACLDPHFVLVARTEALVVGDTVDEALRRAERYVDAGADAIIVHSRSPVVDQIVSFMRSWQAAAPVIVIPTTYPDTPAEVFEDLGVSAVIWANHSLRAAAFAMQAVCAKIALRESALGLDGEILPVPEIFELLDQPELDEAELRYATGLREHDPS